MINKTWIDIEVLDKLDETMGIYTQEKLETLIGDKFDCIQMDKENKKPLFWFTENYVIWVNDEHPWHQSLIILPRNPE